MTELRSTDILDGMSCNTMYRRVSESFLAAVWDLKKNTQIADATIRLDDGKVFTVHRTILSVCSEFFKTMFITNNSNDVHLPGIKSDILELILDHVYMKKIEITPVNVGSLLATSDYLRMKGIKQLCCEHLKLQLNPNNCLGIRLFARNYSCKDLESEAHRYIMNNFVQIANSSWELLECSIDDMEAILGSDELNAKNEETVWETVLRWIDFEPHDRKKYLVRLMSKVRLGLLETQYFLTNVKDHQYVLENKECQPLVVETLKFLYELEMITQKGGELVTPEIARPRFPHEILFAIGGWSRGSPTNAIETYDARIDRWALLEDVDVSGPRSYHATVVIGFDIYLIGGFDGTEYFSSCRCFDAVHKRWREVAPMNSKRCYVSAVVLDDMIYALGGYDGHYRQNTVERYNPKTNQWSPITPMLCQRSDASATILNRKIYITGGFNGTMCLNSAEMFDPETNRWTMMPPMSSNRSGVSCTTYHDTVFVLGGYNGFTRLSSGERFNPKTNTWTPIPDMYTPRSNFAIAVVDDMVFAMGGFNGDTTIHHVECYDEKYNEWFEATNMNVNRSAVSACVIAGLQNIEDYIHKQRDSIMENIRQKLLESSNDNGKGTNNRNQQSNNPSTNVINRNINNASSNNVLITRRVVESLVLDDEEPLEE